MNTVRLIRISQHLGSWLSHLVSLDFHPFLLVAASRGSIRSRRRWRDFFPSFPCGHVDGIHVVEVKNFSSLHGDGHTRLVDPIERLTMLLFRRI
jgi:hypothetical protein